jgi:hypothetical protein
VANNIINVLTYKSRGKQKTLHNFSGIRVERFIYATVFSQEIGVHRKLVYGAPRHISALRLAVSDAEVSWQGEKLLTR